MLARLVSRVRASCSSCTARLRSGEPPALPDPVRLPKAETKRLSRPRYALDIEATTDAPEDRPHHSQTATRAVSGETHEVCLTRSAVSFKRSSRWCLSTNPSAAPEPMAYPRRPPFRPQRQRAGRCGRPGKHARTRSAEVPSPRSRLTLGATGYQESYAATGSAFTGGPWSPSSWAIAGMSGSERNSS